MKQWVKISLWVFLALTVLSAIGNLLQTPEQKEQIRIENERKESDKTAKKEEERLQKEREEAEAKEKQRVFQICNDKIQESVKSPIDIVESSSSGVMVGKLANLWSFACNVEGEVPVIQYIKASNDDLYTKFKADCLDPMSEFTTGSEFIKKNLNDPKSYDHESTKFRVNEDGMFDVIMTFRSKNTFNATVLSVATMQADVGCNARNLKIGN